MHTGAKDEVGLENNTGVTEYALALQQALCRNGGALRGAERGKKSAALALILPVLLYYLKHTVRKLRRGHAV